MTQMSSRFGLGLHQGSALRTFLFEVVMDKLKDHSVTCLMSSMMFSGDTVICIESREQVEERRYALERGEMKVSRYKTEYRVHSRSEEESAVRVELVEMSFGMICDRRIAAKVKGKVYKMVTIL